MVERGGMNDDGHERLSIGTHLASLNLFREEDGSVHITVSGAGPALYREIAKAKFEGKPIEYVEALAIEAAAKLGQAKPPEKSPDRMARQRAEFDAFDELKKRYDALSYTMIVDDDYPEVRHKYEGALANFLAAMKANGRFEDGNRYRLKGY